MIALLYSVVVKRDYYRKGKALSFQKIFCPHSHLLHGHESWVMTKKAITRAGRVRNKVFTKNRRSYTT